MLLLSIIPPVLGLVLGSHWAYPLLSANRFLLPSLHTCSEALSSIPSPSCFLWRIVATPLLQPRYLTTTKSGKYMNCKSEATIIPAPASKPSRPIWNFSQSGCESGGNQGIARERSISPNRFSCGVLAILWAPLGGRSDSTSWYFLVNKR